MRIRVATTGDADAIAEIYAPIVRDTFISFENDVPNANEMASRIETTLSNYPWLLAEADDRVIAYAYAGPHRNRNAYRWSCDVSIYVGKDAQRRGVGRALYGTLFELLVDQGLGTAFAGIALPNAASVALHESLGFQSVGVYQDVGFKNGSWRDVGWWGRKLQDLGTSPSEPVPFSVFRQGENELCQP